MDSVQTYSPPEALTIIGMAALGFFALATTTIFIDILARRGWKSLHWLLIISYLLSSLFVGPLALYMYHHYSRPHKATTQNVSDLANQEHPTNQDLPAIQESPAEHAEQETPTDQEPRTENLPPYVALDAESDGCLLGKIICLPFLLCNDCISGFKTPPVNSAQSTSDPQAQPASSNHISSIVSCFKNCHDCSDQSVRHSSLVDADTPQAQPTIGNRTLRKFSGVLRGGGDFDASPTPTPTRAGSASEELQTQPATVSIHGPGTGSDPPAEHDRPVVNIPVAGPSNHGSSLLPAAQARMSSPELGRWHHCQNHSAAESVDGVSLHHCSGAVGSNRSTPTDGAVESPRPIVTAHVDIDRLRCAAQTQIVQRGNQITTENSATISNGPSSLARPGDNIPTIDVPRRPAAPASTSVFSSGARIFSKRLLPPTTDRRQGKSSTTEASTDSDPDKVAYQEPREVNDAEATGNTGSHAGGRHSGSDKSAHVEPPEAERREVGPQEADPMEGEHAHMDSDQIEPAQVEPTEAEPTESGPMEVDDTEAAGNNNSPNASRPAYSKVVIAAFQCGAACVLGNITGEWVAYWVDVVYGGRRLWVEVVLDLFFSLTFAGLLQFTALSILAQVRELEKMFRRTVISAGLSVLVFEAVVAAWKAAFQLGIYDADLSRTEVLHWFMMQVGMFLAYFLSLPVHRWLIRKDQGFFQHLFRAPSLGGQAQSSDAQ